MVIWIAQTTHDDAIERKYLTQPVRKISQNYLLGLHVFLIFRISGCYIQKRTQLGNLKGYFLKNFQIPQKFVEKIGSEVGDIEKLRKLVDCVENLLVFLLSNINDLLIFSMYPKFGEVSNFEATYGEEFLTVLQILKK